MSHAPSPPGARVYLSVHRYESTYHAAAARALEESGVPFSDTPWPVEEGEVFAHMVRTAVEGAAAMVLVLQRWASPTADYESPGPMELEYRAARELGVPVLAFRPAEDAPPVEPDHAFSYSTDELDRFAATVESEVPVTAFGTPEELTAAISLAVQRLRIAADPTDDDDPRSDRRVPRAEVAAFELSDAVRRAMEHAGALAWSASPPAAVSTHQLLFALVELGSGHTTPRWAGDFFHLHLRSAGASWHDARERWFSRHELPDRPQVANKVHPRVAATKTGAESFTPAVVRIVEAARAIARRTTGVDGIAGRHLAAALLTTPCGALDFLSQPMGTPSPDLLRDLLHEWVRGYGDDDDAWREILVADRHRARHLPRFEADDVRGADLRKRDLLGIERDVVAFATLVASRALVPPLSIGLFGEWGSGKTFFMRRLREEVAEISGQARDSGKPQSKLDFHKHVVQIEFNAWHYVEGNLWASLVEHIFRNLHLGEANRGIVEKMQEHWLTKLEFETGVRLQAEAQEREAARKVAQASQAVTRAEVAHEEKAKELARLSGENAARAFELSGAYEVVRAAAASLGLAPVGKAAAELQASLNQTRALLQRGGAFLTPLTHAPDRIARRAWLAAILLGAPVVAGVLWLVLARYASPILAAIGAIVPTVTAVVGGFTTWWQRQLKWMNAAAAEVERAQKVYDAELAAKQVETATELARAEKELVDARQSYAAALRAREETERKEAEARRELERARAGGLLARFVEDRAGSGDYRKHLGVLATVRDDFEKLSALIEAENARLAALDDAAKEADGAATRINRIVLYIDDLDRCPPNNVVEVLQAVHLLLAFPLFVVVVGVDARWVKRSLETRYRELLHVGGDAAADDDVEIMGLGRADDYLEKIFQLPFWVQPMNAEGSRRLLRGILRGPRAAAAQPADVPPPASGADPAAPTPIPVSNAPGRSTAPDPEPSSPATRAEAEATSPVASVRENAAAEPTGQRPEPLAPSAESLVVGAEEMAFIEALAPLLGRSPRALKRFANVYRIVKASLTPAERASFMTPRDLQMAGYQAVLFLLAVDTGLRELAPELFAAVMEGNATRPWTKPRPEAEVEPLTEGGAEPRDPHRWQRDWLLARLDREASGSAERAQLQLLEEWLAPYRDQMEEWNAIHHLAFQVPRVSQFSFRAERHVAKEPATASPPTLTPAAG